MQPLGHTLNVLSGRRLLSPFPCSRLALPALTKRLLVAFAMQVGLTMALVVLQNGW